MRVYLTKKKKLKISSGGGGSSRRLLATVPHVNYNHYRCNSTTCPYTIFRSRGDDDDDDDDSRCRIGGVFEEERGDKDDRLPCPHERRKYELWSPCSRIYFWGPRLKILIKILLGSTILSTIEIISRLTGLTYIFFCVAPYSKAKKFFVDFFFFNLICTDPTFFE